MRILFLVVLLYFNGVANCQKAMPDFPHIKYGEGENRWLNLYQAINKKPGALLLWAHANGKNASANDFRKEVWQQLKMSGISLISWESVPQVRTAEDVTVCEEDFIKVLDWAKKNASKYNIDTGKIFVAGLSRGSVISFSGANRNYASIRGAYFIQALPDGAWKLKDFRTEVSVNSPKMIFAYADSLETTDVHSPRNGIKIKEQYDSIGIGSRIKMYHSLGKDNLFKYLVEFINENIK
ncbi:MAG: hypothetical protein ABIP79_01215 [Chitinophagaceae bacterium]